MPENVPPESVQEVRATPLNEAEAASVLRNTLTLASLVGRDSEDVEFRIPIAGAQEKTPAQAFALAA